MSMWQPLPPGVKPTGPQEINWQHPLAKGLVDYTLCDAIAPLNILNGGRLGVNGSPVMEADYLNHSAASTYNTTAGSANFITGYPFTLFLDAKRITGMGMSYATKSAVNGAIGVQWTSSGYMRGFVYEDTSAGGSFQLLAGISVDEGERQVTVFVAPSSDMSTWRMYQEGMRVDTGTTGTATFPAALDRFSIASLDRSVPLYYGGAYKSLGSFGRALSEPEAISLSRDPYQFLRPAAQLLDSPALLLTTPPTPNATEGYRIPDPQWEEPAIMVPGVKPTGPVVIDRDHWLGKMITGAYLPLEDGTVINLDSNAVCSTGSPPPVAIDGQHGIGGDYDGSSDYVQMLDQDSTYFSAETGISTLILIASWTGTTTDDYIFAAGNSADADAITGIVQQGANVRLYSRALNKAVHFNVTGTIDVNDGEPHVIIVTFNRLSGGYAQLYVDGVLDFSSSVASTGLTQFNRLTLGALGRSTVSNHFGGEVFFAGHIEGVKLTATQALAASKDIYSMLIPA